MTALEIATRAVRLYAESHPRPPHVTQAQACEMLHLSAPTVRRLIRAGALRLNAAGMIPVAEVDRLIEAKEVGLAYNAALTGATPNGGASG